MKDEVPEEPALLLTEEQLLYITTKYSQPPAFSTLKYSSEEALAAGLVSFRARLLHLIGQKLDFYNENQNRFNVCRDDCNLMGKLSYKLSGMYRRHKHVNSLRRLRKHLMKVNSAFSLPLLLRHIADGIEMDAQDSGMRCCTQEVVDEGLAQILIVASELARVDSECRCMASYSSHHISLGHLLPQVLTLIAVAAKVREESRILLGWLLPLYDLLRSIRPKLKALNGEDVDHFPASLERLACIQTALRPIPKLSQSQSVANRQLIGQHLGDKFLEEDKISIITDPMPSTNVLKAILPTHMKKSDEESTAEPLEEVEPEGPKPSTNILTYSDALNSIKNGSQLKSFYKRLRKDAASITGGPRLKKVTKAVGVLKSNWSRLTELNKTDKAAFKTELKQTIGRLQKVLPSH